MPRPGDQVDADLLITGADVVTMDVTRPLVRDGAIAVRAGQIGWVGTASEARQRVTADLRQLLVCTRELWESLRDAAGELGARIHIHLAEGTYEVEYAAEQWGLRPAEHLGAIGFLSPRVHAAHSILLSAGEIDLYAEHQVSVAHCPLGNFIIGAPKVPEMLRRGIHTGLGTDVPRAGASTCSRRSGSPGWRCRATTELPGISGT
jgi:cytosine/adenosine deaminase-related metal-dependent hydrolase